MNALKGTNTFNKGRINMTNLAMVAHIEIMKEQILLIKAEST